MRQGASNAMFLAVFYFILVISTSVLIRGGY